MTVSNLDELLARIRSNGDRLAVLEARTSNPELLRRLKEAEAWHVELKRDVVEQGPALKPTIVAKRLVWQVQLTATLIADVEREASQLI